MQIKKKQDFLISFLIGLTISITVMVVLLKKDSAYSLVFGQEYFENFAIISVDKIEFWKYVLWNRAKLLVLWFLIGQVRNYELVYLIAVGGIGALLGVMLSSLVMNFSVAGIVVFIVMLLPHGIFYYFSALLIMQCRRVGRVQNSKMTIIVLLIILSLLLGVALESLLSPLLVDKICKIW